MTPTGKSAPCWYPRHPIAMHSGWSPAARTGTPASRCTNWQVRRCPADPAIRWDWAGISAAAAMGCCRVNTGWSATGWTASTCWSPMDPARVLNLSMCPVTASTPMSWTCSPPVAAPVVGSSASSPVTISRLCRQPRRKCFGCHWNGTGQTSHAPPSNVCCTRIKTGSWTIRPTRQPGAWPPNWRCATSIPAT
jgi:hypothetical protein